MSIVRIHGFGIEDMWLMTTPPELSSKELVFELMAKEWHRIYDPSHISPLSDADIQSARLDYEISPDQYLNYENAISERQYWHDMEYRTDCFKILLNTLMQKYGFMPVEADFFIDAENL